MTTLKVLITNHSLASRTGPETYVRDVATGLLKRGHTPIVYSPILGEVANELMAATVPVVDDLNKVAVTPDILHGHHHMEIMTALLHFRDLPAIQFCHGWSHWYEMPLTFPRIRRYVAVDYTCRDRLVLRHGIPEERVSVLLNGVDLERFHARTQPLPLQPSRAVVFSNYANAGTHLPVVREACRRLNLKLDVVGKGVNNSSANPEVMLGDYDVVFAKARCALEALASGAAVVLCDKGGVGPMVDTRNFAELRPLNFGIRTLRNPLEPETIVREVSHYDPLDAAAVSKLVRTTAGSDSLVEQLVDLYEEVIQEQDSAGDADADAEGHAAAAYLRQLKLDFARHGAASMRLKQRVENWPLVGKLGLKLVHLVVGHPE